MTQERSQEHPILSLIFAVILIVFFARSCSGGHHYEVSKPVIDERQHYESAIDDAELSPEDKWTKVTGEEIDK
jgi:membrane-associated protease RseP (regulator of RpoE activity)